MLSQSWHCKTFEVKANRVLAIVGDVTLLVDELLMIQNFAEIELTPGATLAVYVRKDCYIQENTDVNINTADPSRVTITGGYVPSGINGGGVLNTGDLELNDVVVTANTSDWGGGGVDNEGSLTVTDSTISGNTAQTIGTGSIGGGGIASFGLGTSVTVVR